MDWNALEIWWLTLTILAVVIGIIFFDVILTPVATVAAIYFAWKLGKMSKK